jgi:hypothetical protein
MLKAKKIFITLVKNLLLTFFAMMISLTSIEAFLRLVVPFKYFYRFPQFIVESVDQRDSENLFNDPYIGPGLTLTEDNHSYRLRRNLAARFVSSEYDSLITTNELGLRGKEIRKDSTSRILNLGDSFCMGYGVNDQETYSAKLESLLHHNGLTGVEVINAGVLGYNTISSYYYLIEEGHLLNPDVVILQLWSGDDVFGNQERSKLKLASEAGALDIMRKIALRSHTIMFLVERMRSLPVAHHWLMNHGFLRRFDIDLFFRSDAPERYKTQITDFENAIVKVKEYCDQHQIRFYILLLPAREQVLTSSLIAAGRFNPGPDTAVSTLDLEMPNKIVANLTAKHKIDVIDTLEQFRKECIDDGCYYLRRDPHITEIGHDVTATVLFNKLEQEVTLLDNAK